MGSRKLSPAVARERRRCARLAYAQVDVYRHIADRAKAAGDNQHWAASLARSWIAADIGRQIENGMQPTQEHDRNHKETKR